MSLNPTQQPKNSALPSAADCRCSCGNLLARWIDEGVEIKCRRCKHTTVLALLPRPGSEETLPS